MPLNITIHIINKSATHVATDEAGKHLQGELVNVHDRINGIPSLIRRLGFAQVNTVPVDDLSQLEFLIQPNVDINGTLISRSLWRIDYDLLNPGALSTLETINQFSTTWRQFKEVCKNVATGLNLTDEDLG